MRNHWLYSVTRVLILCTRLAEIDVSNDVPDRVTQLERLVSQTLNNLEPSALTGIDTLLQMLHASNPVIAPTSHTTPHVAATSHRATSHTIQMAAAALGQLSQQDPTDPPTPFGPIAGYLHNVSLIFFKAIRLLFNTCMTDTWGRFYA